MNASFMIHSSDLTNSSSRTWNEVDLFEAEGGFSYEQVCDIPGHVGVMVALKSI